MNRIFWTMECQTSKKFNNQEIYEQLFDKKVDKRYLENSVQRFISLNKKMFNFLGVDVSLEGAGNNLSLSLSASSKIGAIPVIMPYDGIAHKDFQVTPRFDNTGDVYAELTHLLSCLEYSIQPDYCESMRLTLPMQLRPPLYYESVKYVELFEKACKNSWVKFDNRYMSHSYPKSNTDWSKHSLTSFDPRKALVFWGRDNILTTNHKEWQELKYVFNIARSHIIGPMAPASIKIKYEKLVNSVGKKVDNIRPLETDYIRTHSFEPNYIKNLKAQANVLLRKDGENCLAWRMDMTKLFETYVQHVVRKSVRELSGVVYSNPKIAGRNYMAWGIRYLEPDIMVRIGNCIYMADAKYKSHVYNKGSMTDALKDAHRLDLHQILAYCSFEPQCSKIGMLVYPSNMFSYQMVTYSDRIGGITNRVIICGIPFDSKSLDTMPQKMKSLFQECIIY